MTIFRHHIYEYRKGLRNLVLHTTRSEEREMVEKTLERYGIDYEIQPLRGGRMNVFFGAPECVETVRRMGRTSLCEHTPEEDFILGIMLGYDRLEQCRRYLRRSDTRQRRRAHQPPTLTLRESAVG